MDYDLPSNYEGNDIKAYVNHFLNNPLNHHLQQNQFKLPMRQRRLLLCPMIHLSMLFTHMEVLRVQTKKTYSTALTKLVLRVKKLEYNLKSGKARRKARIVLSNDEEIAEDSFNQGRKISQIDEDPTISLKGEIEISTASIQVSTTSPPKVSTDVPHVYTRKSAKDKGKAIMEEPATPKKEARALQEEEEEEERLNLEAARELQRQLDQRQENKPVSIAQARRNMITYLKNQGGSEVDKDTSKPSERETSKTVEEGKVEEKDVNPEPVLIEKKAVRIRRKTLARRRASDKQGQDSSKRQKKKKESADYEEEKDKLRIWLTIVPDEEAIVDPEVLHTKYPIVDNESQSLGNMHVYKIIRVDGNTSYHKTFESMLKSFDRQDLEVLHRFVMERFQDNTPEGYNLMLWGDLKILVDPEQDDDI
ncbi:hypothetical protein Tco_0813899 [Tanacetum coccineum]